MISFRKIRGDLKRKSLLVNCMYHIKTKKITDNLEICLKHYGLVVDIPCVFIVQDSSAGIIYMRMS